MNKSLWALVYVSLFLTTARVAHSDFFVIADTNQIKRLPKDVKGVWRKDLYAAERIETVSTNWVPLGPEIPVYGSDGKTVIKYRWVETATIMTQITHRITFDGEVHLLPVGVISGVSLGTRGQERPAPLPTPSPSSSTIAMPLRVVPGR